MAETPVSPAAEGQRFHGLALLKHCGGGAYGEVYYGQDLSGKKMAVKIISKEKLGDHWQRELKGVINYRKITENAPDLLQIFHVEEDDDSFFYTMEPADSASDQEYVPDTLALRLKNGPLPQDIIFTVLSGIFAGLKTIHDAGFAHRDVKPDNILFVKGLPKLGDVGLLSSLDSSFTQVAGTLDFLPPEVRTADGPDASDRLSRRRNDLYAFGKVIYCVVTGQDPHAWPAVPKGLPLTLLFKLLLRLSFQLCDKDPGRRLDSMAKLEKEFAEIKRKLLYGETFRDRFSYRLKRFDALLHTPIFQLPGSLQPLFRYLNIIIYLLFLAVIVVILNFVILMEELSPESVPTHDDTPDPAPRQETNGLPPQAPEPATAPVPEPTIDIAEIKTQTYHNKACGFTLTLPKQWEVLTNKTLQKWVGKNRRDLLKNASQEDQIKLDFMLEMLKLGADCVFCDFDKDFLDNVTIHKLPVSQEELLKPSLEELKIEVRKLFQGELGFKTEIYDVKRLEINGVKCLFIDLSHEPGKTRINNYLFIFPDHSVTVCLTAKNKTFAKRQKEFIQVIRTIKFDKKP